MDNATGQPRAVYEQPRIRLLPIEPRDVITASDGERLPKDYFNF